MPDGAAFAAADRLWNDFMKNVASEIERLGGVANKGSSITNRPNWLDVKNAINNGNSLPIRCN